MKFINHTFECFMRHSRPLAQLSGAALLLAMLVGCATPSMTSGSAASNVASMHGATPVGPQINAFLDNAASGSAIQLAQSPWGPNVELIVNQRYFAASGRVCMQLDVTHQQQAMTVLAQGELACRVEGQGWFTQRLVTDALKADRY